MEEESSSERSSSSYSSEEASSRETDYSSQERSSKRLCVTLSDDRISSLPDSALRRILSFLDMKQAVLTGILSSRWRTLWTTTPILNFTIRYLPDSDFNFSEARNHSRIDSNFINFVDRTLILHFNSNIQRFRLGFLYDERMYASHVDAWIRFAVAREVQELDLDLGLIRNPSSQYSSQYRLPSWLFECDSLVSLKLKCCEIEVSNWVRFSSLTMLSLTRIGLSGGLIQKMLTGCPLLEDLVLSNCKSSSRLRIASSSMSTMRLKRLTIEMCSIMSGLEIQAPNLQILNFDDLIYDYTKYFLSDMLFLREANLRLGFGVDHDSEFDFGCVLESLLKYLGHAKVLKLFPKCIQVIPAIRHMSSYTFNAKCLILRTSLKKRELEGISKLLWRSPFLENLIIELHLSDHYLNEFVTKYDADERDYWESLTLSIPCLVHHLKTIKITGFIGEEYLWKMPTFRSFVEMQDVKIKLVKFLLKNAMVLEKMTIHTFMQPNSLSTEEWTKIILMVAEKLIAIPKASSNAQVLFSYS